MDERLFDARRMREKLAEVQWSIIESGRAAGSAVLTGGTGGVLTENYIGYADIEEDRKTGPETLFNLYSMTKPVTVIAAMQMIERGLMYLDDALADYLPEYAKTTVWRNGHEEFAKNTIRIRDLFTMTSGISYLQEDIDGRRTEFTNRWRASLAAGKAWGTVGFARELARLPLSFEPGTQFAYGLSHDVLGAVVEILSGETLEEYCRKNIFDPLGMKDTCWAQSLSREKESRLAGCYERMNGQWVRQPLLGRPLPTCPDIIDPQMYSGGAGLIGSARDYAKLLCALTHGGSLENVSILSEKSVRAMSTPQLKGRVCTSYNAYGTDRATFGAGLTYGLGFRVLNEPVENDPGKPGEWGWSGALGTWFFIDPADELWFLYLHQHTPAEHGAFVPELRAVFYRALSG